MEVQKSAVATNAAKLIDKTIFNSFKTLTSDTKAQRLSGGAALLQTLSKDSSEEKKNKELDYTLNRLIRGLGASTSSSRAGFFTTLVGLLSTATKQPTVEQLLAITEKQLHVGKGVKDKDDSDAIIGHILMVGALVRTNLLLNSSNEDIEKCVQLLVNSANQKVFHTALAYSFLIDLAKKLTDEEFEQAMWPTMSQALKRQWEKHTINSVHFLLVAQAKYPLVIDAEYLEATLKTTEILSPLSYKHFRRIFWENNTKSAIVHPAYDELARFLCNVKPKQLQKFWKTEIDVCLAAPNKIKEIVTLKVLTKILEQSQEAASVLQLLTPRFIKMVVGSLRVQKDQSQGNLAAAYAEFFEGIKLFLDKCSNELGKVDVILKFILNPGLLCIEKYSSSKIIHQMIVKLGGEGEGVVHLYGVFKSILLGTTLKDAENPNVSWANYEKVYAAQMMHYLCGHKSVAKLTEWRSEELKFFLNVSLFTVDANGVPVKKESDAGHLSKEVWQNVKNIFYQFIQAKMPSLADEQRYLWSIVSSCNEILSKKSGNKYLKEALSEAGLSSWQTMIEHVSKTMAKTSKSKDENLSLTMNILFLQMGLQLFRETDMAVAAIADLVKCVEKTNKSNPKKGKSPKKQVNDVEDEPEWIEVVVDLFLHLLSQNSSVLRNLVVTVFPHLCQNLTLTAVHQILSVLDMKDGKNPLSEVGADESMNDTQIDSEDEVDEQSDNDSNDEEEEADESAEDNSDAELTEDNEGTVSDQVRNAVSIALRASAIETDTESVDLNDMSDGEAERLDTALSAAFQLMQKPTATGGKKKSKKERTTNTIVMHFRVRVLDLIEIYLKHQPTLVITLESALALFNMFEQCASNDDQALANKINKTLQELLKIRTFSSVADVSETNLADLLKNLVERKVNAGKVDTYNQLLTKSLHFLIACSEIIRPKPITVNELTSELLNVIIRYAKEFIQSRNPTVTFGLLQEFFKIRYLGVWTMANVLMNEGLDTIVRSFRRAQVMQFVTLMYKNHGFISHNPMEFNIINLAVVNGIRSYLAWLKSSESVSSKEFSALVLLLAEIHKCGKNPSIRITLDWNIVSESVQSIRNRIVISSIDAYAHFCHELGIKPKKPTSNGETVKVTNKAESDDDEDEPNTTEEPAETTETTSKDVKKSKKLKRKQQTNAGHDSKREKKMKKQERLRIASEGLVDTISFATNKFKKSIDEDDEDSE